VAWELALASDGSPCALHAADWVRRHFDRQNTVVKVITVEDMMYRSAYASFVTGYDAAVPLAQDLPWSAAAVEQTKKHLQGFLVHSAVRQGDPVREILAVVRQDAPDLLVVGHRGLHGLTGMLMGSVAKALVHYSPVPVLVIPQDARD
jgi:nucleotide-binding universal stress UspA family protein